MVIRYQEPRGYVRMVPIGEPAACGTTSGYTRHIRLKTQPCAGCRAAKTAYDRLWRKRNAEKIAERERRRRAARAAGK